MTHDDPETQTPSPAKQPVVHGETPVVAPPPPEDPRESAPNDPGQKLPVKDDPITPGG